MSYNTLVLEKGWLLRSVNMNVEESPGSKLKPNGS